MLIWYAWAIAVPMTVSRPLPGSGVKSNARPRIWRARECMCPCPLRREKLFNLIGARNGWSSGPPHQAAGCPIQAVFQPRLHVAGVPPATEAFVAHAERGAGSELARVEDDRFSLARGCVAVLRADDVRDGVGQNMRPRIAAPERPRPTRDSAADSAKSGEERSKAACGRGKKIRSQCRQGDEAKVPQERRGASGMEKFLESRHDEAATKECDGIAIDIGEGRIGVSEEAGQDGSARHAGNHVDVIEQPEVFESAQGAEMECDGARAAAGKR